MYAVLHTLYYYKRGPTHTVLHTLYYTHCGVSPDAFKVQMSQMRNVKCNC